MILSAQVLALVQPDLPRSGTTRLRCRLAEARRIARKGIRDGTAVQVPKDPRYKGGWWQVQYHWNCEAPYVRELVATEKPYRVDLYARCRKCEACMDNKARYWMGRAADEYRRAARTYMGTFTLSPAEHAELDRKVALACPKGKLDRNELFKARARAFGDHLDEWLSRIRAGALWRANIRSESFRYLLVAERHDSEQTDEWLRGRPHFHMLLHEQSVGALVVGDPLKALEEGQSGEFEMRKVFRNNQWQPGIFLKDNSMVRLPWTFGFTKFELCFSEASAVYVCKYMSKAGAYRVRPSIRYGKLGEGTEPSEGSTTEAGKNQSPPERSE